MHYRIAKRLPGYDINFGSVVHFSDHRRVLNGRNHYSHGNREGRRIDPNCLSQLAQRRSLAMTAIGRHSSKSCSDRLRSTRLSRSPSCDHAAGERLNGSLLPRLPAVQEIARGECWCRDRGSQTYVDHALRYARWRSADHTSKAR